MTSWRDETSQQAQDDLDDLLNAVLPFCKQMIGKYGEMWPHGAAITIDGTTTMLALSPGDGSSAPRAYDLLRDAVRRDSHGYRAVAIAADVLMQGGGDAIRIDTEHREGIALRLVLPYTRRRLRKTLILDDMIVMEHERAFWPGESTRP